MRQILYSFLIVFLFISCKKDVTLDQSIDIPGIDLTLMDTTIRPQDDLFRYVNGHWLANEPIPEDRSYWGVSPILHDQAQEDLLAIIDEASQSNKYNTSSDQYKALQLFNSVIDTTTRNEKGIAPLLPYIERINSIASLDDMKSEMKQFMMFGSGLFFGYDVGPDRKDSDKNIVYIGPGATGLPEREYFLSDDDESVEIRRKYIDFIIQHLDYIAYDKDKNTLATDALDIERQMSSLMLTKEERRDARNTYNPMTIADLQRLAPYMDWISYLEPTGLSASDTVCITQPLYFEKIGDVFENSSISKLKHFMLWSLLNATNGILTMELERINWTFYGKVLNGSQKQTILEERGLSVVNDNMGEALGMLYVDKKFPPEAKAKAERLVDNLLAAFEIRIDQLEWMSDVTKQKAQEKLAKISVKIGYPDEWTDYSMVTFKPLDNGGSYFDYMFELAKKGFIKTMTDLHKPVDKSRWLMVPQDINAYYYPPNNEIVFPAAILQPPYFNYKADMAVNYGGIGAIIGHEISHAFDDSGARFDADGNLKNWWTEEDATKFKARTKALVDEYNSLQALPRVFVNGKFTLGENIGDLGGINAAFQALQIDLAKNGNPGLIDGYTQDERFFLAWAGNWRQKMRNELMKRLIKTDPHSPGEFRANIPVRHMDEFHNVFQTKPGDAMYVAPEDRIAIW